MADNKISGVLISGIGLSLDADEKTVYKIAEAEIKRAGVDPARIAFNVYKKSVDARKKDDIKLVYSIAARFDESQRIDLSKMSKKSKYRFSELKDEGLSVTIGHEKLIAPPLVVGMGPAGLFAALILAEKGYCPIIIDRGDCVAKRIDAYKRFVEFGILDTECNIQFGAGGAGTFSDGKLVTRINDPLVNYILARFCEFGAPEEILVSAKPHIGTDILSNVVDNMLLHIEKLGGQVKYLCRMKDFYENADGSTTVITDQGDINCSALILALGHSSRDTYQRLIDKGMKIDAKPFSVGVRIEHLRSDIDKALYGSFAGHPKLGKGEYNLSDTTSGRGVYTFCMCPGGSVVAAASEEGGVVVNGMSLQARDGRNSNSAVAVSVRPDDFDGTPMGAINFQRRIEQRAFALGGKDYCAPIQTVGDFLSGKKGTEPSRILPSYRDGRVKVSDMNELFPAFITAELKRGLQGFDKKIRGFACGDAILTGAETRTSSPVRVMRNEDMVAIGYKNVYPCGEGAGYAGGITSAAVDGLRAAIKIMARFSPQN